MSMNEEPLILENTFVRAGIILLYSVIFLICLFGNLTVIVVVSLQRKRRSLSKVCLWNMAVANFSVSLFCILQNLTLYLQDTWIFGELLCKLYHLVTNLCHAASILMAVLISTERYVVIIHSIRCKQILNTRTLVLMILGVWLLSTGISLPCFFYFRLIHVQLNEKGDLGDLCVPLQSMYNSRTADTIYFLLLYLVPLVVMTVLYIRIGLFLRQRGRLWRNLVEENTTVLAFKPNRKQAVQKTLNCRDGMQPIREGSSAPEDLGLESSQSDSISSNVSYTFRTPTLPQHQSPPDGKGCSDLRGRAAGRLSGDTVSSFGGTSSVININKNLHASRVLYRYNRLELFRHRCKQRQRVARVFIVIVLSFAVLNLPYHVRKLCLHYSPSFDMASEVNNLLAPFTFALMYTNCAVNPILYAFMSKNFRASLREICSKRRR